MNNINFIAIDFETATAKRHLSVKQVYVWQKEERWLKPSRGWCVPKMTGIAIGIYRYMAYVLKTQPKHLHFQRYGRK